MKKIIVFVVIFLLLFCGLSVAIDNNDYKIYEADKLIERGNHIGFGYTYEYGYCLSKGSAIYLKLIYQEEKKQTEMLQKIMDKLKLKKF